MDTRAQTSPLIFRFNRCPCLDFGLADVVARENKVREIKVWDYGPGGGRRIGMMGMVVYGRLLADRKPSVEARRRYKGVRPT